MNFREIIIGRSDSTVTIFVPWDCYNNCPFCTTKREYREKYGTLPLEERMERVKQSLHRVASSEHIENVVFTGGEPFADVSRLRELIEIIPKEKNIFVNTSLHGVDVERLGENLEGLDINGISLSSHLADSGFFDYNILSSARELAKTNKIRVNSLVDGNESGEQIDKFCRIVLGEGGFEYLNIRADYRRISQETLHSCNDYMFKTLMAIPKWKHNGYRGCLVCRTDSFDTPYGKVDYHRGTEKTSLVFGDKLVINDFVIKQDGEIRYDWDEGCVVSGEIEEALGF